MKTLTKQLCNSNQIKTDVIFESIEVLMELQPLPMLRDFIVKNFIVVDFLVKIMNCWINSNWQQDAEQLKIN